MTPPRINSQCSVSAISAQSHRSVGGVSVESQSMANPLRMRCELISTIVEQKIAHFYDKTVGEIKEKKFI